MKIFTRKNAIVYMACTWTITGTLHAAGYAPWSEIREEEYAVLEALGEKELARDLYQQSLDDGKISRVEYQIILSFDEQMKKYEKEHS